MNGPNSAKVLTLDSVLVILNTANQPLSVAEIVKRLKASDFKSVFASSVRSILYNLRNQGLAAHDSSYRWCLFERADVKTKPATSLKKLGKRSKGFVSLTQCRLDALLGATAANSYRPASENRQDALAQLFSVNSEKVSSVKGPKDATREPATSPKKSEKRKPKIEEIRTCERCGVEPHLPGLRFCKECSKEVMAEMKETGYLTRQFRGHVGDQRIAEMRENVYETKHGTGHG